MVNLSKRKITDTEYRLLGKGLTFCPKIKSHDKIKLAQEIFRFSRRLRLKEYFYEHSNSDQESQTNVSVQDEYKHMPFFNKRHSAFTPKSGRNVAFTLMQ